MTEMPKEILKPCPFCPCGGRPFTFKNEVGVLIDHLSVKCGKCHAKTISVDAWNTRADQVPAQDEPVAFLVECVATNGRKYLHHSLQDAHEFIQKTSEGEGGLVTHLYTRAATQPPVEVVTVKEFNAEWVKTGVITVGEYLAKRFPNGLKVEW